MDYNHGSGSSNLSGTNAEPNTDEGYPTTAAKRSEGPSSPLSSSLSGSSSDNLLVVDTTKILKPLHACTTASDNSDRDTQPAPQVDYMLSPKPEEDAQAILDYATFSPKLDGVAHSTLKDETVAFHKLDDKAQPVLQNDSSSPTSSKFEGSVEDYQGLLSPLPVSDNIRESFLHRMTPTVSPPLQVMERSGGDEPDRIPSSSFERSKSIIPLEWSITSNESLFSIHVGNNSFSKDHAFTLSGELNKSGDLNNSSSELIMFNPTPPHAVEEGDRSKDEGRTLGATGGVDHETLKDFRRVSSDDGEKVPPPHVSWNSSSLSHQSEGSGASTRSFAFPILTEGVKSGSVKVEHDQQKHPHASKMASKSCTSKGFSCFSCFSCSSFPSCPSCSSCTSFSCRPSCFQCCPLCC